MKILLLNAPTDENPAVVPPLGICYIASILRKKFKVKLLDLDLEKNLFKNIKKVLRNLNPDVLMISSLTPQMENVYQIAKKAKEINHKIIIIVGGPHVSALPTRTLEECEEIDIIVVGEGEIISEKICEKIEKEEEFLKRIDKNFKGLKNIFFRKSKKIFEGKIEFNPIDVNNIPFPSRDLLKFRKYIGWGPKKGKPSTHIIASRGCPYNCLFCSEKVVFGRGNRRRTPKSVVDEIQLLKEKYKIKEFAFYDDLFTANKDWVRDVCEEIIKRKINLPWKALSRVDTIDLKTLELMKRAGCWMIFYGYESGSDEILKSINKMTTIEQGINATRLTKKIGMKIFGFFMLGNIGETKETIRQTIEYAKKINPDYFQFAIVRPDPGSPQYFMFKEEIEKRHKEWRDYYAFPKTLDKKVPLVGNNLYVNDLIDYKDIGSYKISRKKLFLNMAKTLLLTPDNFLERFKKVYLPSVSKSSFNKTFE
jgi:anaerobic magnesium-protoporphyrin IX monomethyl ester cyclase